MSQVIQGFGSSSLFIIETKYNEKRSVVLGGSVQTDRDRRPKEWPRQIDRPTGDY